MKGKAVESRIYQVLLILTVVIIAQPLFNLFYTHVGHDTFFHLYRIKEIEEAIKLFRFPMYIGSIGNANSIDPIFYPNLFLYIPAMINLIIKNINISYNLFKILIAFGYVTISYYSVYIISKDEFASSLFAISYSTFHAILFNIYIRDAVGEYLALMFVPLYLASLYNIYFDNGDKWFNLVIATTFILQSHIITIFYLALFTITACLILAKKTFTKHVLIKLFESFVIILLINLWFIVPFISSYFDKLVFATQNGDSVQYISKFINLIVENMYQSKYYINNYSYLFLFYIFIIGILLSLPYGNGKKGKEYKIALYCFAIFFFYFLLTFKNPLTELIVGNSILVKLYGKQQFSFRVVARSIPFLMLSFSFLVSALFRYLDKENISISESIYSLWKKLETVIKIIILVFVLFAAAIFDKNNIPYKNVYESNDDYDNYNDVITNIDDNSIYGYMEYRIADENSDKNKYLMVETKSIDSSHAIKVSSDEIKVNSLSKRGLRYDISYEINSFDINKEYFIDIPFRNYNHFVVRDGNKRIIDSYYGNDNNNIRIKLSKGIDIIHINYETPIVWKLSKYISILMVILLLFRKHSFVLRYADRLKEVLPKLGKIK